MTGVDRVICARQRGKYFPARKGVSQRSKSEVARKKSHMTIGPWEHGVSQKTGDLDFGPSARVEREALELPFLFGDQDDELSLESEVGP